MSLTEKQIAGRAGKLTASRVGILMNGTDAAVMALWREMIGDPDYVPEDLSGVWPVQLGSHTESLNLDWYERTTGRTLERGASVTSRDMPWAAATLDGWDAAENMCVEAKHVNAYSKLPDVIGRYAPQLHWQMYVTQTNRAALSVIIGAAEPTVEILHRDLDYMRELLARAAAFWRCVETMTPPIELPPAVAIVPHHEMREVDMGGNNAWAQWAAEWVVNRPAAKMFDAAAKELKKAVPDDARRAHGHGVEVTRAKNGALTIKEL